MNALIEKHLNASLTAGEAAALATALAEDPALADEFAAATRMESELRTGVKEQAQTALYTRRMERAAEEVEESAPRRRTWLRPAAVAAGVAVLAGGGWAFLESQRPTVAQQYPPPRGSGRSVLPSSAENPAPSSADAVRGDAAAVKRKLRRFAATGAPVRGIPVSQALSSLESQWKSFDHRDPRDKDAVAFTIAETALKSWPKPEDEPVVALEIPGISLLTSVELIAAQAGLRTSVTSSGVTLEPDTRKDDGRPRTWNLPLTAETFTAFLTRAGNETARNRQEFTQSPLQDNVGLSWMASAADSPQSASLTGRTFDYPTTFSPPSLTGMSPALETWIGDPSGMTATGYQPGQFDYIELNPGALADSLALVVAGQGSEVKIWDLSGSHTGDQVHTIDGLIQEDSFTAHQNDKVDVNPPLLNEIHINEIMFTDDGQTIDLNLAPELIEFEGFLNYGSPIQTTGINALGQSEPVILTDSKITQPVFATRTLLDHPATLTNLLFAHGVNTAGITWDETNGAVTARGSLSELRIASATLAAVRESAQAGVSIEIKVLEWADESAPATTDDQGIVSGADAAALTRRAKHVFSIPKRTVRAGEGASFSDSISPDKIAKEQRGIGGAILSLDSAVPSGSSWIVSLRGRIVPAEELAVTEGLLHRGELPQWRQTLPDGAWLRAEIPANGTSPAATILLSAQPATVH